MTTDAQAALAQVREALAAGPTPREWLIAGEDKSFVYSLGPHGTNAFWAHVQAAGPERISEAEKGANAKLIAACSPANIAAILAHVEAQAAEIKRLRKLAMTTHLFEEAPCFLCGYNGPGYYQPEQHPCAALYHEAMEEQQ